MRIQIILFILFHSFYGYSATEAGMNDLFKKYDLVMEEKKVEFIDEVFTKKFIADSGGKEELIQKVKELSPQKKKNPKSFPRTIWRKGLKALNSGNKKQQVYFAKFQDVKVDNEFIVIEEDGKLKIDGTISDGK